jgi:CheY-like chemotaxis protein
MTPPKRVVVVDDDPTLRQLIERALPAPEFEVHSFGDPRDALMKLHDIAPDLIVCDLMMPETDGRTFFRVVKRSQQLRHVPFIFLSAVHAGDEIVKTLEEGADDFLNKPFELRRLVAKIRATLRMSERLQAVERRQDRLTGPIGPSGALALLRFCEDRKLTGRLTVESAGVRRWADFQGGDLVESGGAPGDGEDALDAFLAAREGTYVIEQKALDPGELDLAAGPPAEPAALASEGPPAVPGGRLSSVDVPGGAVQVQTEAENRPDFTVTTVVARAGQVIRKIESAWGHPLQRREDVEAARLQIDRQHDRVVATLKGLGTVDAALLAWACSFVAEQVRNLLGSVMTVTLLRRTHRRLLKERDVLRVFRVAEDGRVVAEGPGLGPAAVGAVADWIVSFLAESAQLAEKAAGIRVRQVTRMMESDLDAIGFYAAVDAASRP